MVSFRLGRRVARQDFHARRAQPWNRRQPPRCFGAAGSYDPLRPIDDGRFGAGNDVLCGQKRVDIQIRIPDRVEHEVVVRQWSVGIQIIGNGRRHRENAVVEQEPGGNVAATCSDQDQSPHGSAFAAVWQPHDRVTGKSRIAMLARFDFVTHQNTAIGHPAMGFWMVGRGAQRLVEMAAGFVVQSLGQQQVAEIDMTGPGRRGWVATAWV